MNHTMHGIIFSYGKPTGLGDLIAHRIPGSMPFGGNYRVVDFMLSSMVNAGIHDVGVIMHGKCQSMLDHLGNGRSWDLSRNRGGLTLLPAFAYAESRNSAGRFRGKVEALGCVLEYLRGSGRSMWCWRTAIWSSTCRWSRYCRRISPPGPT